MGESEGAVDGGGGQEGEEADEENAGEEQQGGEQHRCLEHGNFQKRPRSSSFPPPVFQALVAGQVH